MKNSVKIIILFFPLLLFSRPMYLKELPQKLKKCKTCHMTRSGGELNSFGKDFNNFGMKQIMEFDSDGDGFINSIEIKKGTNPGDPSDFPLKKGQLNILILPTLFIITLVTVLLYIKKSRGKMIELGKFSLIFSFIFTPLTIIFYSLFLRTKNAKFFISAQRGVLLIFSFISISSISLIYLFITNDFRVEYVANYTSKTLPIIYRISAFWAGMEGSLLLWALVLSALILWLWFENKNDTRKIHVWAMTFNLGILFFFITLLLFLSNPFKKLPFSPPDGMGLNPLLQNISMLIHPPSLYFGYVGFSIPFSYAMASLITGEINIHWITKVRKWTILSWIFLTIGILYGGRWAYVELGWGGYWAWDPVENASFMPWLTGTAFLHSVMMQEKRNMLKIWNMILIMITFALTIFGTYITRSGVLTSVHAFAQSNLGPFFLAFISGWAILFLVLLFLRWGKLKSRISIQNMLSREGTFYLNNWILVIIAFTIFWGVLFPIVAEIIRGVKVTVGPPFYQQVTIPFFLILLLIMGICPSIGWRKATLKGIIRVALLPLILTILCVPILYIIGVNRPLPLVGISLSLLIFYIIIFEIVRTTYVKTKTQNLPYVTAFYSLLVTNKRRYGGFIVHLGIVFTAVGIIFSSAFKKEIYVNLKQGQISEFMGYKVRYSGIAYGNTEHYLWFKASLNFIKDKESFWLKPEKRFYRTQQTEPHTEVDIKTTLSGDFYTILESWDKDETAFIRIQFHPFIHFIWMGGFIMILGGAFALLPDRKVKNKHRR